VIKLSTKGKRRSDKYNVKFDADVVRSRFAATAQLAKDAQVAHQTALAELASDVRGILDTAGEYPIVTSLYLSFANKLYGICNKFSGATAIAQASMPYYNWLTMGAKKPLINQIWTLFNATLGSPPSP
jgi:hypothetical protein